MSKLLEHQLITNQKRIFNPKDEADVALLKRFIKLTYWGKPCPFLLEDPYLNIPAMMKDKYIKYQLGIL
jgi:hypothetical protein